MTLFGEVQARLTRRRTLPVYDAPTLAAPFILYPMQVSNDTQLVMNSRKHPGNIEAITYAAELARNMGCALYVRPHPAEPYGPVMDSVFELKNKLKFKIVRTNTFALLNRAEHVVTINSTVGLSENIGKTVTYLGDSYFTNLTYEKLGNLIRNIIDVDYFSDEPVKSASVFGQAYYQNTWRHLRVLSE
ncbi:MAG: hypothetical protein R3E50_15115 [Halioglobus sp.]